MEQETSLELVSRNSLFRLIMKLQLVQYRHTILVAVKHLFKESACYPKRINKAGVLGWLVGWLVGFGLTAF